MNRTIIYGAIAPLFLLLLPNQVFALSDQERFDIGWQSGVPQAQYDWNNNLQYDPLCPSHHSDSFCLGYRSGYNHWWDSVQQLSNRQVTEQNANVDVQGNGNHVTVDQQSGGQAGNNRDGGQAGGSANPRCIVLCANVQIK
jgi:hypothetical protein